VSSWGDSPIRRGQRRAAPIILTPAEIKALGSETILRPGNLVQTTLDLYTQEDSDETRAAQGAFLSAVRFNREGCHELWVELWVGIPVVTPGNSLKGNGGDDETRTRDLCRDRA
jgi:hypothetical protein